MNDITPIGVGGSIRPKSFIDVVSIVQNYFLAEKHGNDLPENLLTLKGKIVISEVGFKGAFISGLISILLTPFFVGVVERCVPIFGSYEFTLFDQAFAVALALSFAMGYSLVPGLRRQVLYRQALEEGHQLAHGRVDGRRGLEAYHRFCLVQHLVRLGAR